MVECELISTSFLICLICVLIDTWWNVNLCGLLNIPAALTVLIDTWWNVNLFNLRFKICSASFNRYMVECEFVYSGKASMSNRGFNRYMVECELKRTSVILFMFDSFNRYIVECE